MPFSKRSAGLGKVMGKNTPVSSDHKDETITFSPLSSLNHNYNPSLLNKLYVLKIKEISQCMCYMQRSFSALRLDVEIGSAGQDGHTLLLAAFLTHSANMVLPHLQMLICRLLPHPNWSTWGWQMVSHTLNPRTHESKASGSLSLRTASSTEKVPGQTVLHRETLSQRPEKTKFFLYQLLLLWL